MFNRDALYTIYRIPLARVYRWRILHCFNYSEQTGICLVWKICPVAWSKTHGCPRLTPFARTHAHTQVHIHIYSLYMHRHTHTHTHTGKQSHILKTLHMNGNTVVHSFSDLWSTFILLLFCIPNKTDFFCSLYPISLME